MPDIKTPTVEGAPAVADTPVETDSGAGVVVDSPALDLEAYGDHLVSVTIDGETQTVPLREAAQGYQRQADYTRKTQEVADVRHLADRAQAIERALKQDAAETLRIMAEAYNVDLGSLADGLAEQEPVDPFEQRVAAIETQFRQQAEAARYAELEANLNAAVEKYGVDADAVVQAALNAGIDDLDFVARALAYEAKFAAEGQAAANAAVTDAKVDAKRTAPVHAGGANGSTSLGQPKFNSFDDAAAAALRQHGFA